MLLPHPAVIVPNREKARFTIGDEGTLLGLNISEPVSHRKRGAALEGLEMELILEDFTLKQGRVYGWTAEVEGRRGEEKVLYNR